MPSFILAYRGWRKPESPESGARSKAAFQAWIVGLGDAVVNPGTPLGMSKTVSAQGVAETGEERLTGFSIVRAEDMGAALEMAKACPYLVMGTVEVAQVMEMT
jgi:hypothetical protein